MAWPTPHVFGQEMPAIQQAARAEDARRITQPALAVVGGKSLSVVARPVDPQRVLLVEDVGDNRESVVKLVGHTVAVAADGPGLRGDRLGEHRHCPRGSRTAGIRRSRSRRVREDPHCAVVRLVALTGYARDRDRTAGYATGFDAFLVKPFDLGRFEQELRERG